MTVRDTGTGRHTGQAQRPNRDRAEQRQGSPTPQAVASSARQSGDKCVPNKQSKQMTADWQWEGELPTPPPCFREKNPLVWPQHFGQRKIGMNQGCGICCTHTVQRPKKPSFWLLCPCSPLETQSASECFEKSFHSLIFVPSMGSGKSERCSTLVVCVPGSNPAVHILMACLRLVTQWYNCFLGFQKKAQRNNRTHKNREHLWTSKLWSAGTAKSV